jgi:hypothetical protein
MDEVEALNIIKEAGLKTRRGCILLPVDFEETEEVTEAINYLWNEWDFACIRVDKEDKI